MGQARASGRAVRLPVPLLHSHDAAEVCFGVSLEADAPTDASGAHGRLLDQVRQLGHGDHGRMERGGHGLPKISRGPAMPYPSTPCGQTTPGPYGRLLPLWTPLAVRL
jgi:hypothetical protein